MEIHSLETAEKDIHQALDGLLPGECTLISKVRGGSIIKYGLLDLEFRVSNAALTDNDGQGIPLLKTLGFVLNSEQAKALAEETKWFDELADDPTCLRELTNDLTKDTTLLKLFLEGEPAVDKLHGKLPLEAKVKEMLELLAHPDRLSSYFPQHFTITDACLTNAGYVWFHKHFYL